MGPVTGALVRRRPPLLVLLAASSTVVTAVVIAGVDALLLFGAASDTGRLAILVIGIPTVVLLVVGARLLVQGQSWLPVFLPAGAITLLVGSEWFFGSGGGDGVYVLLAWSGSSAATALLAALCGSLPTVRRWRAARQRAPRAHT